MVRKVTVTTGANAGIPPQLVKKYAIGFEPTESIIYGKSHGNSIDIATTQYFY